MPTTRNPELQISSLTDARGCIRDLVALSALPAMWVGSDLRQVGRGVADALFAMLRPILAYVAIKDAYTGALATECARTGNGWETEIRAREMGRTFAPWMTLRDAGVVQVIHSPLGDGMARMVVTPIGHEAHHGFIVVASQLVYFPSAVERLLLSVGANQAAVAAQNARLLAEKQESDSHKQATSQIHNRLWTLLHEDDPNDLTITRERLVRLLGAKKEHGEQVAHWLGELRKTSLGHGAAEEPASRDDAPRRTDPE